MRVERHDSELGRWEMTTRPAATALRPHVVDYIGYRERTPGPSRSLELPSSLVHVIVSFGPRIHAPGPLRSFVAPPEPEHTVVESEGEQHLVEFKLTPLGARRIFGAPLEGVVALEDLLGRTGTELPERLYEAGGWAARFALLDELLGRRLAEAPPVPAAVEDAWRALVFSHGAISVAELARRAGWSRRHLVARFREHVGLPPKTFARILRFQRATSLLADPSGPSLCEIALDAGYYDQAHLNRDFRAFAGRTPTELLAARRPASAGWRA